MTTLKEIDVEAVVGDIATHIKNQFEGILARVSKDKLNITRKCKYDIKFTYC